MTKDNIEEKLEFLQTLLDTIPAPVFYKGVDGRYMGCNNAFETFVGISSKEIIGKTVYDMGPKEIADKYYEKDRELFDNPGNQCYEWKVKRKNGEVRDVIFYKATFKNSEGEVAGLIGVISDITEHKRMEEKLRQLSVTDALTGLYNRRGFFALAEQQLKMAKRLNREALLLSADTDNLKDINDTLGHKEGGLALIDTANILRESFRESDIIARIGGDEFVVLQIENIDVDSNMLTNRLQNNLEIHNANRNKKLSISIGIIRCEPECPYSIEELLIEADKLMYKQKRNKQKS